MIDLYTAGTPNGYKISIALEELGLEYAPHFVDLSAGEQKEPWFLAINPNGRIPVIIDRDDDRAVFDSGAILIYLAEKAGRLLPHNVSKRWEALQWLMFQMSGVGPMQGQLAVFQRYAPQRVPYAIERYERETLRLYGVLDGRLSDREYLADEYSIADIATYPWVYLSSWVGLSLGRLAHLRAWIDRIGRRAAVRAGMNVPPREEDRRLLATGKAMV